MFRRALWMMFAVTGLLFGGHASAQDRGDDEITVTGQRDMPRAVAKRYVGQITSSVDGQLARFADPVCPVAIGLPDAPSGVMLRRLREIAAEANVRVADALKCEPNIVIIVAADADHLIADMRRTTPQLFRALRRDELKRAMRDGPVHVWNVVQIVNEDGKGLVGGSDALAGGAPMLEVKSASILHEPTKQEVALSIIVFDSDAMIGKSLEQLSGYIAMRVLAGARSPRGEGPVNTILTLFDAGTTPLPSMSLADAAYLRGLYTVRPNARSIQQMNAISSAIAADSKRRMKGD